MTEPNKKKSIAIVGGGITGLAAALDLAKSGRFEITIFEKQNEIGGLNSYYQWQDMICDRYYHVVLPNDKSTLNFIEELGLITALDWRKTKTGFYGNGRLVSLSSTLDFIRFPFLSLWQKFRLGLGILYSARIKDSSALDRIYAHQWLSRIFGKKVYENIWKPLLGSKLGETSEKTSAAFIWANISRLYGARKSSSKQEEMGYIHGGYHSVLSAAKQRLSDENVQVLNDAQVTGIESEPDDHKIEVSTDAEQLYFDRVLLTLPSPDILRIINADQNINYWQNMRKVEYLGLICVLLVLKCSLSPYYVINLLERDLPFTGIIESTNVISSGDFGKRHLVYLPKYLTHDDSLNSLSDSQISSLFIKRLKTVFPGLTDEEILHTNVFREKYVQPIQGLRYLEHAVDFRTPTHRIYVANSSMIYNSTINNNAAIELARRVVKVLIEDSDKEESF